MTDTIVLPCSSCGTANRLPRARLGDVPVCSDCRARLVGEPPAVLTAASFDGFVQRSDLPVLVDFWAPWCGPCRAMAPHFEEAGSRMAGRALFAKVDTEQHPALAARMGITGIPTLVLLDHGVEMDRMTGARTAPELEAWVHERLTRRAASSA